MISSTGFSEMGEGYLIHNSVTKSSRVIIDDVLNSLELSEEMEDTSPSVLSDGFAYRTNWAETEFSDLGWST